MAFPPAAEREQRPVGAGRGILRRRVTALGDGLFLAGVVVLSLVLYVPHLGFYSDDWDFLGTLSTTPDQSLGGLVSAMYADPELEPRPTPAVFQALLYWAFGPHPLGYHLVNAAVLVLLAVLLLFVLRELAVSRLLAVTVPAVYLLLPNYSTDRFWFAAFGYALSLALWALSLYADLRAIRSRFPRLLAWKALALAALVVGGLGYEIVIPLLFANLLLVWLRARRLSPGGLRARLGGGGATAFLAVNVVALGLVIAFKAAETGGQVRERFMLHVADLLAGSVTVAFVTYGAALPYAAWWGLQHAGWGGIAIAAALGAIVFAYLRFLFRHGEQLPQPGSWLRIGLAGIGVFLLGFSIFVTTWRVGFTSTGIDNRTAVAGALGAAVCLVAFAGLLAGLVRGAGARERAFSSIIAGVCVASFLVTTGLSTYWHQAWSEERRVLALIDDRLPTIGHGKTILLHGVCAYTGPAIVFESNWDLRGALQTRRRESALRADVTTSSLRVDDQGISTLLYRSVEASYRFADGIVLLDGRTGAVVPLPDRAAFRAYVDEHPNPASCRGTAGKGETIFVTDRLYEKLRARFAKK